MLAAEMAKFPRFKVPALRKPPAPHRRRRKTAAQIAEAKAARIKRAA